LLGPAAPELDFQEDLVPIAFESVEGDQREAVLGDQLLVDRLGLQGGGGGDGAADQGAAPTRVTAPPRPFSLRQRPITSSSRSISQAGLSSARVSVKSALMRSRGLVLRRLRGLAAGSRRSGPSPQRRRHAIPDRREQAEQGSRPSRRGSVAFPGSFVEQANGHHRFEVTAQGCRACLAPLTDLRRRRPLDLAQKVEYLEPNWVGHAR
jgi:hypothetical protein